MKGGKILTPRTGLIVSISPYERGAERAEEVLKKAETYLSNIGLEVSVSSIVKNAESSKKTISKFLGSNLDLLCLIEQTWSQDNLITDILQRIRLPVITWALPSLETGSLCGVQQLNAVLKEKNFIYQFVFGEINDIEVLNKLKIFGKASAVKKRVKDTVVRALYLLLKKKKK